MHLIKPLETTWTSVGMYLDYVYFWYLCSVYVCYPSLSPALVRSWSLWYHPSTSSNNYREMDTTPSCVAQACQTWLLLHEQSKCQLELVLRVAKLCSPSLCRPSSHLKRFRVWLNTPGLEVVLVFTHSSGLGMQRTWTICDTPINDVDVHGHA